MCPVRFRPVFHGLLDIHVQEMGFQSWQIVYQMAFTVQEFSLCAFQQAKRCGVSGQHDSLAGFQ